MPSSRREAISDLATLAAVTALGRPQPMLARLQAEMPRLGFTPQTPAGSTSPIVTFAQQDAEGITKKLAKAGVTVRVADYWMRIAPSVFNDMADIDRLLEALS